MADGEMKASSKLCCELGIMANAGSNRGNDANLPHANTAILGSQAASFSIKMASSHTHKGSNPFWAPIFSIWGGGRCVEG